MKKKLFGMILCMCLLGSTILSSCSGQSEKANTTQESQIISENSKKESHVSFQNSQEEIIADLPDTNYTIEFYVKGEKLSLKKEEQEEVYQLALESVNSTDTMLNQLLTADEIQTAKMNGIAVTVKTFGSLGDKRITMILSEHSSLGSDGGSAHALSGKISGRLQELAGWQNTNPEDAPIITKNQNLEIELQGNILTNVAESDMQPLYEAAQKIIKENTETPILINGSYAKAVNQQGLYLHIKNTENQDIIELYLPWEHTGYAIYNHTKSYEISQGDQNKLQDILKDYERTSNLSDDPLKETGVQILYYGKLFLTDSDTQLKFKDKILEIVQKESPVDSMYPADMEELALKKGIFAKFRDENEEIYKVFLKTTYDGNTYYIILSQNQCWEVGKSVVTELEELFGVTLS